MNQSAPSVPQGPSLSPWLLTALVVIIAAGGFFWINQRIETLQMTVAADRPDFNLEETKQTLASLQQIIQQVQADQQKLGDQIAEIQRGATAEQADRKALSDRVGALGTRIDALASAQATAAATNELPQQAPQVQKNKRRQ
ncbi:hypothetical protein [Bradyrhizobium sp. SZCCHNRI3037]|uniref:hypothetical protein n=1 Tax=Bradyrhizobium sp. SZCCHNRI3037 TaxID=3057290 RepID=UPI002916E386|nr:hypothetical protein [Bradyrhizobium sp. SZCCHNRI3037]